ncbi:hypothetical protein BC829DRAFT_409206 [Chytridium lagenaria]|nr:hypothetical protein BC829DRAFT_409206 [Chytridium lagenaria]
MPIIRFRATLFGFASSFISLCTTDTATTCSTSTMSHSPSPSPVSPAVYTKVDISSIGLRNLPEMAIILLSRRLC